MFSAEVTDQVSSDAQVLPDGILVLGRKGRGLTDPRPLRVNLPHWIFGDLGEDGFGCIVFLQSWKAGSGFRTAARMRSHQDFGKVPRNFLMMALDCLRASARWAGSNSSQSMTSIFFWSSYQSTDSRHFELFIMFIRFRSVKTLSALELKIKSVLTTMDLSHLKIEFLRGLICYPPPLPPFNPLSLAEQLLHAPPPLLS